MKPKTNPDILKIEGELFIHVDEAIKRVDEAKKQIVEEIFKDLDVLKPYMNNIVEGNYNYIKQKYLQNQERDSPKGIGTDNNESLPDEVKE